MAARLAKIDEVVAGDVLTRDVVDGRGTLLFKVGVALTDVMIERIRARNVSHVFVEGTGPGLSEADLAAQRLSLEGEVDLMFADVADQPRMVELREAAKQYLKGRVGT
jgi:hypothetical protein